MTGVDTKCYEFLLELGAGEITHYGRPLIDHLKGTHDLLREWGNADEVCVAGLFHSIYGTEQLVANAVDFSHRARVQAVIGERSEKLAFLFSVADRTALLTRNMMPPYHVVRHDSGETLSISSNTLSALVEIGAANLVEQMSHRPETPVNTVRREVGLFQGMQDFLSGEAGRALFVALAEFEHHQTGTR